MSLLEQPKVVTIPSIQIVHPSGDVEGEIEQIHRLLGRIPELESGEETLTFEALVEKFPVFDWQVLKDQPRLFVFRTICKSLYRFDAEDFVKNVVGRWLLVGRQMQVVFEKRVSFFFTSQPKVRFSSIEIGFELERDEDRLLVSTNIGHILKDLKKGLSSSQEAHQILTKKGISIDEKDEVVRNEMMGLIQKRPHDFENDFLKDVHQFLFTIPNEFKYLRETIHLSRLASTQYLFRKTLFQHISSSPSRRHVLMKMFKTTLHFKFGKKNVLGLLFGITILRQREVIEEQHVIEAIQNIIPEAILVQGSYTVFSQASSSVKMFYIEIEKEDGRLISLDERKKLRELLPSEVKEHIEHLVPMTFVRRNEEELYRNILLLREELQLVKDIPQVVISFEEQTHIDLFFTIALLRVVDPSKQTKTIEELFKEAGLSGHFIQDRTEVVGYIRKKYVKEANVFRLQVPKSKFLRKNRSVDVAGARQFIGESLRSVIGKFRDFNGGLILKQDERLQDFMGTLPYEDRFQMENFFYSITPIVLQGVIDPVVLRELYMVFVIAQNKYEDGENLLTFESKVDDHHLYCVVGSDDPNVHNQITKDLHRLQFQFEWVSASLNKGGTYYTGYLFFTGDSNIQEKIINNVQEHIDKWIDEANSRQHLRLNFASKLQTVDPRITRSDNSSIIVKMLFEGLTRLGPDKKPQLALASRFEVSEDKKTYVFYFREAFWSDGSAITAKDFEYSWKNALKNGRTGAHNYTFQFIKNGSDILNGNKSHEEFGVSALSDSVLKIELEQPVPFILELLNHWTFLPTKAKIDVIHPGWAYFEGDHYVCNGPFKLKEWKKDKFIVLTKNDRYWDASGVHLEKISISLSDNPHADLQQFKSGDIDFSIIAPSVIPNEVLENKMGGGELIHVPLSATFSIWFNTTLPPLSSPLVRRALSMAIDRNYMAEELLEGAEIVSWSILPPCFSDPDLTHSIQFDPEGAKKLFKEGIQEGNVDRPKDLLPLYYFNDKRKKVLEYLIKQWKEVLGFEFSLVKVDKNIYQSLLSQGDHAAVAMGWSSWFDDPHYILSSVDKTADLQKIIGWKSSEYSSLIAAADKTVDEKMRAHFLNQAETLLQAETPVMPLHSMAISILKKRYLRGVVISETGEIDFRGAYFHKN